MKEVENFIEAMTEDDMWITECICDVCKTEIENGVDGWVDVEGMAACWDCMWMCYKDAGLPVKKGETKEQLESD